MKTVETTQKTDRPPVNSPLHQIMSSSAVLIVVAMSLSLLVSAVLVVAFDQKVQESATYLLARPSDFFGHVGAAFASFFTSLFRGAISDYQATSVVGMIIPVINSLTRSVLLILVGLSIALALRADLFNVGTQGQLLVGATLGVWTGLNTSLPYRSHLLAAMLLAVLGGTVWGAVPGILKTRVGANEVIVIIMMNSIAMFSTSYFLKSRVFIGSGYSGRSSIIPDIAAYPKLLNSAFNLHLGFLIALLTTVFIWWLLGRSTFSFKLRAAGANLNTARTAGISVNRVIALTIIITGALVGLAGTGPALGTERFFSAGTARSIGFDAIAVALLGVSTPLSTVLAGISFRVFASGASTMQAVAGIPVDIISVSQAVIVLLIAAPLLVRQIFELPESIDSRITEQATPPVSATKVDSKSEPTLAGAPYAKKADTQPEDEAAATGHETTSRKEAQS